MDNNVGHTAYLGLGSNLGDREAAISRAIALIGEQVGPVEAQSALYFSEPWGYESEHEFVNAAIRVSTVLTPLQLLDATQAIERQLGKTARHATERSSRLSRKVVAYHDRPIDIDILLYDNLTINTPRLRIPHPLMLERPFVMEPLRQVLKEEGVDTLPSGAHL